MKSNIYLKNLILLWFLYLLTFSVVYFTNQVFIYSFFIILLLLFWRSEEDFFWIAFFLLLFSEIGGLFPLIRESETDFRRLPIFNIGPVRIPFRELFLVIAFIKSIIKGSAIKLLLRKNYIIFIIYFIVISIFSVFIGISYENIIQTILYIIPFTLFITIPRLFKNSELQYFSFFRLILSGMIFVVLSQIFDLITGIQIGDFFKGKEIIEDYLISEEDEILRMIYSPYLNILCLIFSFLFLSFPKKYFRESYLNLIIIICFLSIFLSATRGWILSYVIMLILFMWIYSGKFSKTFRLLLIAFLFIGAIYTLIPNIKLQSFKVLERFETLEYMIKGDITAGGTLSRITVRAPRVWNKFLESPIWGFGISDTYYENSDAHLGHHNILLQTGIIGYLLFLYFWFQSNYLIFYIKRKLTRINVYKPLFLTFLIGFIGIFIIHSTSTQMFGFTEIGGDHLNKIFLLAIYYSILDFFIKRAIKEDKIILAKGTHAQTKISS